MKNAAYWRGRFSLLENAAFEQSEQAVRDIEAMYTEAQMSVQKEIEAWCGRFAKNNGLTLAEAKQRLTAGQLAEFRWTVAQYTEAARRAGADPAWMKALENASARVHISRLESIQLQIQQQAELLYGNQLDRVDALLRETAGGAYTHAAYEIQKGLGVGWNVTAPDEKRLGMLLAKPWTTDGRTFRDRCWLNKEELVNAVQKNLVQGLLRGDSPEKAIAAIQKQFGVSRYKARRLVHTETSYFAAQAAKDAYRDLDVEKIEIVEALDSRTCEVCGAMDGKVISLADCEPGVTVPPFHPNCRGTTCPYFDDMDGERAARDADGKVYYVPEGMRYREWKRQFVNAEESDTTLNIFQPMTDYRNEDGSFDLEAAKDDYRKFLQTVPEKYRIYLEQSLDAVTYRNIQAPDVTFAYSSDDEFLYNPNHPAFYSYDFRIAVTHEFGHRIDNFFVQSWRETGFQEVIKFSNTILERAPDEFFNFCKKYDKHGCLSDILSAICRGKYKFPSEHEQAYWNGAGNCEMEIFSNLFTLDILKESRSLELLTKCFPDLMNCFYSLISFLK